MRERVGARIAKGGKADLIENLADPGLRGIVRLPDQALPDAAVPAQGQLDVIGDTVTFEDRRLLELAADAEPGDRRLVELGQVDLALEERPMPVSGRVLPVMTSIMVVLPAPLGPMMARISPGSSTSDRFVQRLEAVEADRHAVEIEDRVADRLDHGLLRRLRCGLGGRPSRCAWAA